jgi:hypothetical protein
MLKQLQRSDPIFSMRVDVMRPACNLEPKYRVTVLTREGWTRRPGTLSVVNPLNAELNPICHLLALLGGATIVVVSRLRVKRLV